jgi:starvation-inducible outer membrane lipoprotein
MKSLSLLLMLVACVAFAADKAVEKTFGKMEPQGAQTATLTEVTSNFSKYKGQNVSMTGTVKKVCQSSGCWFELAQGTQAVRITMKDYGFTVPKDILNKKVTVVGVMESKELPVKAVKHYMKDEGRPQAEIDKVTEPQKTFEFVANGVALM